MQKSPARFESGIFVLVRFQNLKLAFTLPFTTSYLRSAFHGLHQNCAQAKTAFHVSTHNFKSDFVDSGTTQEHLPADVPDSNRNIDVRFRAHAEVIVLCAHSAAKAQFAKRNAGFPP